MNRPTDSSSTQSQSPQRKLAAILYADVAGYSRLTGEDEHRTHRLLSAYLDAFAAAIQAHNGTVKHYAGDAVLADFTTVTDALTCAVAIQRELKDKNEALPEAKRVQFRIGVNLGEVIVDRGEVYGNGVNVAARLESLSEPGGICVSGAVVDAIGTMLPLRYESRGEQTVKNIDKPVRAYWVTEAQLGGARSSIAAKATVPPSNREASACRAGASGRRRRRCSLRARAEPSSAGPCRNAPAGSLAIH